MAALNGQGPPKRPCDWQVKQLITFRFVPCHVQGHGNVPTITDRICIYNCSLQFDHKVNWMSSS